MKKITLFLALFLAASTGFSQSFMHGAGITVLVNSAKGGDISYAEGLTYSPRFNFIETESLSVSAGIPLSFGISSSISTNVNSSETTSIGFVLNAPLIISLNMGRGSTKDNTDSKFGYFVGGGFGYHHGDFLVDDFNNGVVSSKSTNTFGPAANAGVRIGVGRKHKSVEVRLSYMKGLSDSKPNVFGLAGLFNF
jgi:hypothetical protein